MSIRTGTRDDAALLAAIILTASRGHLVRGWFDLALDRSENECLDFLRQLTVTVTRSMWHYSRFLVAESSAGPVAALSAFPAADAYPLSPIAIAEAGETLALTPEQHAKIWERGEYAFTCTVPPNDVWVIENVATLARYRRCGYTSALLERALEAGRLRGLKQAQVTFLIGNESAQRTYEKAGFRLVEERRHPDFEAVAGSPGLTQFVRSL